MPPAPSRAGARRTRVPARVGPAIASKTSVAFCRRLLSSKRHVIPGCETIRISKPNCLDDQGEGLTADAGAPEVESSGNAWVYCAFI